MLTAIVILLELVLHVDTGHDLGLLAALARVLWLDLADDVLRVRVIFGLALVAPRHVGHEILGRNAELIPVGLIMARTIVALTELLNQLLAANVSQLLPLISDQNVNLVPRQVNDLIHSEDHFINVELLNNLIG